MFNQPKIFALLCLALGMTLHAGAQSERPEFAAKPGGVGQAIAAGPFKPDWNSLTNYHTPDWFRDAKFGIWAHYSCQCGPECGDWYAHYMYQEGSPAYLSHLQTYGHPSTNGFKEIIVTVEGGQTSIRTRFWHSTRVMGLGISWPWLHIVTTLTIGTKISAMEFREPSSALKQLPAGPRQPGKTGSTSGSACTMAVRPGGGSSRRREPTLMVRWRVSLTTAD